MVSNAFGKEHVLPSALNHVDDKSIHQSGGHRSRRSRLGKLFILLGCSVFAFAGGCDTELNPLEMKSFLDPGEMGRYKSDPLILPIVDRVDAYIEEPNAQFVN